MKSLIGRVLIIATTSLASIGCTVYPKNYTYSPSVSINGAEGDSHVHLPNPFAKTPRKEPSCRTTYVTEGQNLQQTSQANRERFAPKNISFPFVQIGNDYYYEADPDSNEQQDARSEYSTSPNELDTQTFNEFIVSNTRLEREEASSQRDIDGELSSFIIP